MRRVREHRAMHIRGSRGWFDAQSVPSTKTRTCDGNVALASSKRAAPASTRPPRRAGSLDRILEVEVEGRPAAAVVVVITEWAAHGSAGHRWLVDRARGAQLALELTPRLKLRHLAVLPQAPGAADGISAVLDVDSRRPPLDHNHTVAEIEAEFRALVGDNAPSLFNFADFI